MTMATAIFDKFVGDVRTVPENILVKFEVSIFRNIFNN